MSARGIAILGSTGSIGCNSLRVIESLGRDRFEVVALAAGRNVKILADQIAQHHPQLVSVESEPAAAELHELRPELVHVVLANHHRRNEQLTARRNARPIAFEDLGDQGDRLVPELERLLDNGPDDRT